MIPSYIAATVVSIAVTVVFIVVTVVSIAVTVASILDMTGKKASRRVRSLIEPSRETTYKQYSCVDRPGPSTFILNTRVGAICIESVIYQLHS